LNKIRPYQKDTFGLPREAPADILV